MTTLPVDPLGVAALADLLGADDVDLTEGAPLPPLWHWVALARWRPWASLGPDGHGHDPLLPVTPDLPRRMFAGGAVRILRPLRIGYPVTIERVVESVRDTVGSSGPLRFVTTREEVRDAAGVALVEHQDLVYRPAPAPGAPPAVAPAPSDDPAGLRPDGPGRLRLLADPVLLMRFSALTANNHRIHYDRPYATGTEGHADLVVHGPLLALAQAEAVRRATAAPAALVRHRGRAPLHAGRVAHLALSGSGSAHEVRTTDAEGRTLAELTTRHEPEETP